jgi:radical SAM superfamily enzyme YgiQ (UPF0313 family)
MNVLVISANTEKLPDPVYPIGAAYVADAARGAGHEVAAVDLCFTAGVEEALGAAVAARPPDVIGISLRNLDSSAYPLNTSYVDDYARLVAALRRLSGAPIVLGGAGFTVMPETVLGHLHADVGVVGEGERLFPWVLDRLAAGAPLVSDEVARCEPVNGGVCVHGRTRAGVLDALGVPARDLFDAPGYYERGGTLNVQTKRGCAFDCIFCSYPLIEGRKVRARAAALVVDEIAAMKAELGVRHVFFVDNIFNLPIEHAKEICAELVRREVGIEWSAYLNPKFIDEELVRLMAASGCKGIELGIDSGSPAMLETLHKMFSPDDLRRVAALCHQAGLKFCHSLIFGGPGETMATVEETIDLMEDLRPSAVVAMTGIRILPGTQMVEHALRDGQMEADDDLLYPRFYVSPGFADDIIERIDAYARSRPNWIVPGQGIKTNVQVLQRLRARRIKGPLWRLLSS